MEGIVLVPVSEEYAREIEEYRKEYADALPEGARITADPERIPGLDGLERFESADAWLEYCRGQKGRISWYAAVRTDDGEPVGFCCLRHELKYDDDDPPFASHIGYSVRPKERGKGYATEQLRLMLRKAAALGIEKARVICADTNEASRRVIIANGGVYVDSVRGEESGITVERYDIPVRTFL